jgi:cytochrome c-type biogenesis protein CcmH/NrfG
MAETVEDLCHNARQAIAQGQIEQARQWYLQALALRSDVPDVHYGLATACFLLNDLDSAAYHFKEVTRLDPLRPGAYINLGAVYNRLEEYDEAVQTLRRGIQLDPHRAEGYYNLGLVYRNMGKPNLAVQAYLEATRVDPRMVDAHFNLGNLYLEIGRHQLALSHYKKVLQLRPNWDKALNAVAQAEKALGITHQTPSEISEAPRVLASEIPPPNLDRLVDPVVHGELLTILHHATIDSENQGREFLQLIEHEVEPAIKDLSNRLLGTGNPSPGGRAELNQCIHRFETAIANMRSAHRELESSIQKMRSLGEQILHS